MEQQPNVFLLSSLSSHYPLDAVTDTSIHSILQHIDLASQICNEVMSILPPLLPSSDDHTILTRSGKNVDRKLARFLRSHSRFSAFTTISTTPLLHMINVILLRYLFHLLITDVRTICMKECISVFIVSLRSMHVDSLYWIHVPSIEEVETIHTKTRMLLSFQPSTNEIETLLTEAKQTLLLASCPEASHLTSLGFSPLRTFFDDDETEDENGNMLIRPPSMHVLKYKWNNIKRHHPDKIHTNNDNR